MPCFGYAYKERQWLLCILFHKMVKVLGGHYCPFPSWSPVTTPKHYLPPTQC
ncbi:unnamed protein product [Musa textilis]